MQGATVKSLPVRHSRVLMAVLALTWLAVITALVRQLTSVAPAPLHTATPTTRAVTVVLVTALGCAAVHQDTQVVAYESYHELEIRSVERGICPIAKSTITELFL